MSAISPIFVTTNTQYRRESCLVSRYAAFLLPEFHNADKTALRFTVNGSQSVWPCIGCWSRCFRSAVSLFLTYQSGKEYISVQRIKRPTQMRNYLQLQFLQEQVTDKARFIQLKRMLTEVFTTYFISDNFTESTDQRKDDAVFLATMYGDLLDELYLDLFLPYPGDITPAPSKIAKSKKSNLSRKSK